MRRKERKRRKGGKKEGRREGNKRKRSECRPSIILSVHIRGHSGHKRGQLLRTMSRNFQPVKKFTPCRAGKERKERKERKEERKSRGGGRKREGEKERERGTSSSKGPTVVELLSFLLNLTPCGFLMAN